MKICNKCQSVITHNTKIRFNKDGEVVKVWLVQECNCISHSVSLDYAIENKPLYVIGVWNESKLKLKCK